MHGILENYLKTGIVVAPETPDGPDLAAIAESGLHFLPDPKHFKIGTEDSWSFEHMTPGGLVLYNGRKDFEYDAADGIWTVGDHKTTGNLRYALNSKKLATDPQGVLYAAEALATREREEVRLQWVYYLTKRPWQARLVEVVLNETHVATELEKLDEIVGRKMLPLVGRTDLHPKEVEANLSSCDKYGGCPFRSECDQSPAERLKAIFHVTENPLGIPAESKADKMSAILEKLKAAKALAASMSQTTEASAPAVNPPENEKPNTVTQAKAEDIVLPAQDPEPAQATIPEAPKARKARGPNKPKPEAASTFTVNPGMGPENGGATKGVMVLYLDCSIFGELGDVVIRDVELYQATVTRLRAEGIEDYQLVDFGKGAGAFATIFGEVMSAMLTETAGQVVTLMADTKCREWSITSAIWRNMVDVVVKG